VRLLLDTSALIRWHTDELRPAAVRTVQRADLVVVSAVSAWEIAIKRALGKLEFDDSVEDVAAAYGFDTLPVTVRHGDLVRELPAHHSDPFDRLLIVQALEDGFTILTSDSAFEAYRVPIVST
jgi:PIN domain nuclease of toxin-antitoxin system